MCKKSTILIAVTVFALSFGVAVAQNYPSQDQPSQQTPSMGQTKQISGVVTNINIEKKKVTIKDPITNESKEYSFTAATLFSKGTETATSKDLKMGDKVALEIDSQNKVSAIRITPEVPKPKN